MTDTSQILCSEHKVPLEGPVNAKPDDRFSCPVCGVGDTRENVFREAREFVQEQAAKQLEGQMASIAADSKFIKFKPASRPQRVYRFVVETNFQ